MQLNFDNAALRCSEVRIEAEQEERSKNRKESGRSKFFLLGREIVVVRESRISEAECFQLPKFSTRDFSTRDIIY